ncbi:hypothetical protein [Hymenobacter sp. CRA2]|uniref:hypothetical protein n=1 Tax=Hymenobacter sp. CRA2 TaxID=1955620 RepID=UPI00098FA075|nr:hypothetical protein [Hymenobacter sp. CRA2]OON67089.1 hypothetical protein B0919_19865 [Hymenobacter sp. CRA2]
MKKRVVLACGLLGCALSGQAQEPGGPMPGMAAFDSAYQVGGIRFGTEPAPNRGLRPTGSGVGKRWKTTKLYQQGQDTLIAGAPTRPTYWVRNGRFIGITCDYDRRISPELLLAALTKQFGPPRAGDGAGSYYWLGRRTYVLLEPLYPKGSAVHMASLDMLNEQVMETRVRQEARTTLGWKPDATGLPRQLPTQH